MSDSHNIIIKKVKKVSGDGHHGGAWKVAYADFVTAMMAFFLLMWLLNATTEDQRKGIADYFSPSIPLSTISGGGEDLLEGETVFAVDNLAQNGTGGDGRGDSQDEAGPEDEGIRYEKFEHDGAQTGAMEAVENNLMERLAGAEQTGLARHIRMKVTPEGIVIDLVDVDGAPLYDVGSTTPSPTMRLLLQVVASTLELVENDISIVGHTDRSAFSGARDYSNWELSTDRAHAARRLMTEAGLPAGQISEVAGKADTEPLADDPYAPQNRRISITILKG